MREEKQVDYSETVDDQAMRLIDQVEASHKKIVVEQMYRQESECTNLVKVQPKIGPAISTLVAKQTIWSETNTRVIANALSHDKDTYNITINDSRKDKSLREPQPLGTKLAAPTLVVSGPTPRLMENRELTLKGMKLVPHQSDMEISDKYSLNGSVDKVFEELT